ncbi:MAG: 50S ribosomal protein L9 [Terriglobales bacterium]
MEIILKQDVLKLGRKGDVLTVADGYGRNFLLPQRKAIAATPANLRNIEQMRASAARKDARDRDAALALAAQLAQLKLVFQRRAGAHDALFGSVTSMDIMHALAERGYEIERRKIELPDPLKTLGEHPVALSLFRDVKASLLVLIEREAAEAGEATAPTPQAQT